MTIAPFIELPEVGSLIEVVLADGRAQSVRAVEVAGLTLTIAATMLAGGVAAPQPGDLLTLRWVGRRGRCAAPCLVRTVDPVLFATWTVEAVGTVEIEQRRRFARSAADGRVHIGPDEPDVGLVLVGELLDIGEGGLRCRVTTGGVDPQQPVFLRLLLDDRLVTLRGTVLRLLEPGPAGDVDVVVTFESDAVQAQAIRRYVLARQLAERAVRADGTD
jgi:PilZ domain